MTEYPIAGGSEGLYLWPNPVIDELHIAWRGNLRKMPALLAVHDVTGRLVVSGMVDPYRGAATWRCAFVTCGTYLRTAVNESGSAIATAVIVKQ